MNTMTSKSLWPRVLSGLVLALVVGCAPAGTTEEPGPETPTPGTTTDSPATLPDLGPTELRITFLGTGAPRPAAEDIAPGVVFDEEGLTITAFDVAHRPIDLTTRELLEFEGQTLGFRIDYGERSLVLSGDTRESASVVEQARGVDVLVHEVQVPSPGATEEAKLANVSLSVHSGPEAVARIFAQAQPRMAVYSHIIPPDVTAAELAAATDYDGPLTVAHDLMMITIGEEIVVADRSRAEGTTFEGSDVLR